MRIAIDVRSLMEGRHSGVEEYTIRLIQALQKEAPQHEYVLFYNSWRRVTLPNFGAAQVRGWRFPNRLFNLWQLVFGWPFWDRLVQADVFMVPNARLLPLRKGVPLVVTAHDLSFERFPEFYSWRRRLWHRLMRPRELMRRADAVVAVSQATADDVVSLYGVRKEQVTVVYSGIRHTNGAIEYEPASDVLTSLPERFVLFLGTLEPRKNVVSIVEAFEAIAADVFHDLVIAGSSGWLTGEVERAVARSSARARIHRVGFVTETEKQQLYQAADLFVYPSFYEGFGFPPLEALLAGTPVITSHNSSLPEVVGEWATMVNPYDVAELAVVMRDLLNDLPVVSGEMQHAIRERFSWERAARETLAVIEQVAKV